MADDSVEYNPERHGPTPQRFIDGCKGDLAAAGLRWAKTAEWREREGVDTILYEPQPLFKHVKAYYPQMVIGKAKNGRYVYCERPGLADFEARP